jgi:delta 1-pyrroline-5-carboxylate dehydrogenase
VGNSAIDVQVAPEPQRIDEAVSRREGSAMAEYDKLSLLIDGVWLASDGRVEQPVINPATGETLGALPHASKGDLDRALEAARRGFETWRSVSPYERAKLLRRAPSGEAQEHYLGSYPRAPSRPLPGPTFTERDVAVGHAAS